MNPVYFKLHSCCQMVRGATRTLLLDTQRRKYWLVPAAFSAFVAEVSKHPLDVYLLALEEEEKQAASGYLDFMITHDIGFYCDTEAEMDCFPDMSLEWQQPFVLTNAIIELDDVTGISLLIKATGTTYIPCIQFVLHRPVQSAGSLEAVLKVLHRMPFKTCQLLFDSAGCITGDELSTICSCYPAVEMICGFNADMEFYSNENDAIVILTKQQRFTNAYCGIVHQQYFNVQLDHYTESLAHNTCLNRKISIDVKGNIKNCPSMKESFGNIADTTLATVLDNPAFKKYWNITKDQIAVCRDCEFRHICTDCRAYRDNPDDVYSKPLKCGYDPYTATWTEWSTHPLKQHAIRYYDMEASFNNE